MNKDKIKSAVEVYLNENKSDYAIMLNGKWGSGKTYFVKNELIKDIQNKDDRQVIYISLFGITSIDELYNNISLHILLDIKVKEYAEENKYIKKVKEFAKKDIKEKINCLFGKKIENINLLKSENIMMLSSLCTKGLSILPKSGVINSIISDINNKIIDFNKYVFIFDDLERNSLSYGKLLGFFDKIADQNNLKAILVCDENKIKEKDKDEFYKTFKEKVIGLTIEYNSNMDAEFDNIVSYYVKNEDVKKYFSDNKKRVLSLFKSADSCNLRTLIFACKRFTELYEKIEDTCIKYEEDRKYLVDFFREILLAVVGSSILIKEQYVSNDFKDQEKVHMSVNIKNRDKSFYLDYAGNYCAYKFIDEYLNKYYFDYSIFEKLLLQYIENQKLIEQNKIKAELISIYNIDDDKKAMDKLNSELQKIENNTINVNVYPEILNELFILCSVFYREEYIIKLKKIILKNVELQANSFSDFSWSGNKYYNKEAELFKKELYKILIEKSTESKICDFIDIFHLDDNAEFVEKFIEYMRVKQGHMERNSKLMSIVGVEKVFKKIKSLNSKQISDFWNGLSYVYQNNLTNLNEFYHGDKDFFENLKIKIENELLNDVNKSTMQKQKLRWFCNYLNNIYDKL